jgi:hypothetical protein
VRKTESGEGVTDSHVHPRSPLRAPQVLAGDSVEAGSIWQGWPAAMADPSPPSAADSAAADAPAEPPWEEAPGPEEAGEWGGWAAGDGEGVGDGEGELARLVLLGAVPASLQEVCAWAPRRRA